MSSWGALPTSESEAISNVNGKLCSTRPSMNDFDSKSKGYEGGITNILRQEQEVRALQKALNLPQTTHYSTSLAFPTKPAYFNSSLLSSSAHQTRVTTQPSIDTASSFMHRTLQLERQSTVPSSSGFNREFNSSSLANRTRVGKESDRNTELENTFSSSGFDRDFTPSSFPFSSMRESRETRHQCTEDCLNNPNAQERSFSDSLNLHKSHLANPSNGHLNESLHFHKSDQLMDPTIMPVDRHVKEHLNLHKSYRTNPTRTELDGHVNSSLNLYKNNPENPIRRYVDGLYDTRKGSSEDREIFGKAKEAYKIIQHQNETIARSENIISDLNRQLKTLELEQEANLQEIQTLKVERQNTNVLKSDGTKKKEALIARINQLDQDFKELSLSHNALLVECKKREGDVLQSDLKLNALEAYNNNLRQANARMQKECEMAKQQVNDIMAENRKMQMESQQARGETAHAMQDKQRIALENTSLQSSSSEVNQQLLNAKSGNDKLRQELDKIKMEYNVKCNRVSLLEEEVKQQQETFTVLQHELEQSFQREARKTAMDSSALFNTSLRQRSHSPSVNGTPNTTSVDIDKLKNQLMQKGEENSKLNEQLLSAKSELARLLNKNKSLKEKLDYSKHIKGQLEQEVKEISVENESLYADNTKYKELELQSYKVKHLQEELEKIKGKLAGLETEKCSLMSELQEFQKEKVGWEKEKGELIMSLAELEAENNELRQKLKTESGKVSESVGEEVQAIKQELDNVHKMLRLKDEELVNQSETIEEKQNMLNKLTEEATELKKGFADISARTTTRNLVISSLGKQLEEKDKIIAQLENELDDKIKQFEELCSRHTNLEKDLSRSSSETLQWMTADKKKLEEQRDLLKNQVFDLQRHLKDSPSHDGLSLSNDDELESVRSENAALVTRLETLVNERDSVLQDSEDLMEGMAQLKEAFEDEIERRLEREREKYVTQQDSIIKEHKDVVMDYNNLKEQHKVFDAANKSLELQCKNLEFERDELRKQVNELCENTTRSKEKTTQTDVSQPSPRRKEPRGRKRSKSVGVIVPIISIDGIDGEEEWSSPDRSPTESPRRNKSPS